MRLSSWSVWHILGAWVGWILFLVLAAVTGIALAIRRARPSMGPSNDLIISVTGDEISRMSALLLLLLLPPLLLTLAWAWQRFGDRGRA
jgi:hypothetical protein